MDDYEKKLIDRYTKKLEKPLTLYHYTTQVGLLGIFDKCNLWATDILYLNDETEFTNSAKLIEWEIGETLSKMLKETTDESIKKIFGYLKEMLRREKILDDYQVFVCSFSLDGNLLSLWRGYCPENNGFSVGFDYSRLKDIAENQKTTRFHLLPCFYEKEDQESIVKELKKDIFDNIAAARLDNAEDLEKISEDYTVKYLLTSTILKNRSFSQENEWRLFGFKKKTNKASNVQFRKGKSLIVPYLKIRLKNNAGETPIEKIYVGPTPHKELAVESTKLLVASKKINCPVRDSDIPYRGW